MKKSVFKNILENVFQPSVNQAFSEWLLSKTWTTNGMQSVDEVTLTSETTYEVPFNSDNRFAKLVLGSANLTALTADIGDLQEGDEVLLQITQDGTVARTISWSTGFAAAGGTDPTVTDSTDAVDLFKGVISGGEVVLISNAQDIATLTA